MKNKFLLKKRLLAFMLLLFAPVAFSQRLLPKGSGAITANVQDGQDYQVFLVGNVTSFALATTIDTPNNIVVTIRFTQNSQGSWTVTFGGNITTACPITSTANATSICRFQYDSGSNTWTDLNLSKGNAATATALASAPSNCTAGNVPTGIDAQGNALNCNGVVQTSVTNNFTASQNFKADIGCFKGPNPYVDIRCFGARAVNPNTTPAAVGLTANCTNTLNTVTISAASTFVNGDGVILYGCGAAHSMTTPVISSVTPSLAIAGTGTLNDAASAAGGTTYNYKVIARDRNGGLTQASAVVSTTTGQATLGGVTANITSMSRSGQTVTVVTAAAHNIATGCGVTTCGEVFINSSNGLSDITFKGWYTITSAADTTHFTFVSGPSTALGASASSTGGTFTVYNVNKVCWGAVTGAVQFYLLSDRANPGTYAVIDGSIPNSATGTQDLCLEDYGSPFMDNQVFPPFITGAAPWSSPTSDHLSTTITSGAGTTNLTLANAAGTTVTGATIRLDSAPAILAANIYQQANGGFVQFPATAFSNSCFVINSWLQIPASTNPAPFHQSGCMYLNDTMEFPSAGGGGLKYYGDILPAAQGSQPPGAWGSYPQITVNSAAPGLWFSVPQQYGLQVRGLQMTAGATNGGILMVVEGGFNQDFEHINFIGGSAANDFISKGLILKAGPGQSNSNVVLNFVDFVPGGGTEGVSHTPTLQCRNCGIVSIPNSYSVHRGMLFTGSSQPSIGIGGVVYINGGGTPLITMSSASGGGFLTMGNITLDTIADPCVASLTNAGGSGTSITFLQGGCLPSSNVLGVSGQYGYLSGFNNSTFVNSTTQQLTTNQFPQTYFTQSNQFQALGSTVSLFTRAAQMAAPTCAVSAGGTLDVGSYNFEVGPVWGINSVDAPSVASTTCTTSGGNQTITVNWTAASGNPAGYEIYTSTGGGFQVMRQTTGAGSGCGTPFLPGAATNSWVINTARVFCGISPLTQPVGGPTMLMSGNQGIAAPLVQAPNLVSNGLACTNAELALSAGWQSTGSATVTAAAGLNQTCSWTITTGTTTAANPTVTDTLVNALPSASTVCEMNIHGGTHTAAAGEGFQQTTLSATAPVFTFNGTPTAGGTTYFITRRCGP